MGGEPRGDASTAWLALDAGDNQPASFWGYVIAALRAAEPGIGGDALALLQAPQPPIEAALATLLNDLAARPDERRAGPRRLPRDRGAARSMTRMTYLLEHLPPRCTW